MADLRDFTGKNSKFTGSIGERISTGSTGDRNTSAYGAGTLRFNNTTNLMAMVMFCLCCHIRMIVVDDDIDAVVVVGSIR